MVHRVTGSQARIPGDLVIDAPPARSSPCSQGCQGAHSWADDGRRACWRPTGAGRSAIEAGDRPRRTAAVDVERTLAQVPRALAARWPMPREDFWRAWTRSEVRAKLHDVPILAWLARNGLDTTPRSDGGEQLIEHLWSGRVGDLTVSVGRLEEGP